MEAKAHASQTPKSGLTKDAQRHGILLIRKALKVLYRFQGSDKLKIRGGLAQLVRALA